MSAAAMQNPVILSKIMRNLDTEKQILNQLQLRLVSKSFNSSVLSLIRQNHRTVTITPDSEELFDKDGEPVTLMFRVNYRYVQMEKASKFFQFLNFVAEIRVRSLTFADFLEANEEVHDVVMLDLIGSKEHPIEEFHGAADMCERGCESCYLVAKNCKIYGPMQCYFPVKSLKHFENLQVDEIWLYQVSKFCTAKPTEAAFEEAIRRRISPLITCDHLELILSDRYFESEETGIFSRRLIDEMTIVWKVKRITVTFVTGRSAGFDFEETFGTGPEHPLEPFGFDMSPDCVSKSTYWNPKKPISFEQVEINLLRADRFIEDFNSKLSAHSPVSDYRNLISVVQKLFPTPKIYVSMPPECLEGPFDQISSNVIRFSWCQEKDFMYRGTEMFVRFYKIKGAIQGCDMENFVEGKPCNRTTLEGFGNWPTDFPKGVEFDRQAVTFMDQNNRRNIHCEVLMRPRWPGRS